MVQTAIVELDHVSATVRNLKTARAFYEAALGAIGMKVNMDVGDAVGMGSREQMIFWLAEDRKASGGAHFAFRVKYPEEVHAFHETALKAGGKDNGPPGPRPNYGSDYYAAFVKDREGNNIEVVCYVEDAAKAAPRAKAVAKKSIPGKSRAKKSSAKKSPAKKSRARR